MTEQMNVQELIDKLLKIKDKTLPVRLWTKQNNPDDNENYWLDDLEVHDSFTSGYEIEGEVILSAT